MKVIINKSYLMFLGFLYFFVFRDFLESYIPILGYMDELIAMMAIPIVILSKGKILKNRCFRYRYPIYGFILVGLLSSLCYKYQPLFSCAMPDLVLNIKFWFSIITGYYVFRKLSLRKYAKKMFFHVKLITWMYICLIVLEYLTGCFNSSIRYGLRAIQLFYSHQTVFSACCVLLIGILLSIRDYVQGSDKYFALLLILMCTTLRSKALGAALMFSVFYYIIYRQKKKVSVRTLLLLVPAVIAVAWDQIYYYFFSSIQSDSARYQLLVKAVRIANDHLPLGAGFGTYGSYFSTVHYSVLYNMYNLSGVHGLRQGSSNFASDNFWPMILGETGWIGLLLVIGAMGTLFMEIQKIRNISVSCYFAGICIFVYLLIASTAEAAFVHPVAVPLAVWLGFLFAQKKRGQGAKGTEMVNQTV